MAKYTLRRKRKTFYKYKNFGDGIRLTILQREALAVVISDSSAPVDYIKTNLDDYFHQDDIKDIFERMGYEYGEEMEM